MEKIEMPQLSYSLSALEGVISENTMNYHYGKHLKAYVDNVNKLLPEHDDLEDLTLSEIIVLSKGALFNNAAQVFNHAFYFENLSPKSKAVPEGELLSDIEKHFGSFDEFKQEFEKIAMAQFGSGWAWLSMAKDGTLMITSTDNAVSPLNQNLIPLMTVDLWEHAYYLDYQNQRAEYLKKIWAVIDWEVVLARYMQSR